MTKGKRYIHVKTKRVFTIEFIAKEAPAYTFILRSETLPDERLEATETELSNPTMWKAA
jgi:hypothetical protein